MLPRDFAARAFTGQVGTADIEHEVATRWRRGDFLFHLGPSAVPPLPTPRRRQLAYGEIEGLISDVLFAEDGGPGCLVVTTPPQAQLDETYRRFLVPPHVHRCHHAALVTAGEARYVVVRPTRDGPVLIDEPVARGSLIYCPADAVHTFVTRRGFEVASLHARYLGPDRADFAQDAGLDAAALPRLAFDEFRRSAAAGLTA